MEKGKIEKLAIRRKQDDTESFNIDCCIRVLAVMLDVLAPKIKAEFKRLRKIPSLEYKTNYELQYLILETGGKSTDATIDRFNLYLEILNSSDLPDIADINNNE